MPPKRKALAEASTNKDAPSKPRNAKTAKTKAGSDAASKKPVKKTAGKASAKGKAPAKEKETEKDAEKETAPAAKGASKSKKTQAVKYSNANTLTKKPKWVNLQWPNIADFIKDKNQDMPKKGQLIDEYCYRVSDLGIPVSEAGGEMLGKMDKEYEKRNQDRQGMHIYEDWNGWGMSEMMENLLKDFNRDLCKKTISPFQKWAYIEGLACFLKGADLMYWMGNENGEAVAEIAEMLGTMLLASYPMLAEHDLLHAGPEAEIKNIGIVTLLLLEFLGGEAFDLDCQWGPEVVGRCDEAGIKLEDFVRKQVAVEKKTIQEYREQYEEMANEEGWKGRDWTTEYKTFKKEHAGGTHYDLTKMSKADKKSHTLGTKAFSRRIGIESDGDDSD